jgi:AhpC/TSA family
MKRISRLLPVALAFGLMAASSGAQEPAPTPTPAPVYPVNVGDQAPDFTLEGTDGKTYTYSKDLKGRWLVLAWFPKAYTGG